MGGVINELRDEEQKKALNNWAKAGYCGSLIAGTGFGKSRCGVVAINHVINILGKKNALILVPTVQLQDQFRDEFRKWGYDSCLDNLEILCYQSAYKLKDKHYDIVVCDEIHLGLSKEYRKFFKNNTYDKLLCMTATLPDDVGYKMELFKLARTIYTITLDECVDMGFVAPYEIYCIPVELTFGEQLEYDSIQQDFVKHKVWLGPEAFDMAKFFIANKQSSSEERFHAAGFYKAMRERKKVVDTAYNKISKFKEIVSKNLEQKIITFGGLNEFTDSLAESVSPLAEVYHSKRTMKERKKALKRFKEDDVNILCSTKALNQGFDIPNANIGIICGLTSKALSMVQRIGRLIRYEEGKTGKIYIIYVKDSQEEKWLNKSVADLKGVKWL
jgi:superfamily II DNA or RNA helicase|tara:strand:- start:341 stop:1501 length:1161 start_codon:yes stop_codon:yes gene_type:complete